MKKLSKILVLILCFLAISCVAFACNENVTSSLSSSKSSPSSQGGNITFKTLLVDGNNVSGQVSNSTLEFDFNLEIDIIGNVDFAVSSDIGGNNPILSKKVTLADGDNTYYIFKMLGNNLLKIYTVNIYRKHLYEVSFKVEESAETIFSQYVEEGELANIPQQEVTKSGYDFKGWDFDFTQSITQNQTIIATWQAKTDTPYKVEYYLESLETGEYEIDNSLSESLTGTTDSTVYAEIKQIDNFTPTQTQVSGVINGNGSTAIKVYYNYNWGKLVYQFSSGGNEIMGLTAYGKTLTQLTIPEEIYGTNITSIGSSAFKNCTKLTKVTIGNNVASIGDYAFSKCSGLTNITIPNSVTSINNNAFYGCYKLVEVYNNSNLTFAKGETDNGCVAYYALAIYTDTSTPSKLTIDSNGFMIFTNGAEKILVGYVGTATELVLPSDITDINKYAFYKNNKITSVVIGNGVISIGNYAFRDCDNLASITIGEIVTSIGVEAFFGCSNLAQIINNSSLTFTQGSNSYGYIAYYATSVTNNTK